MNAHEIRIPSEEMCSRIIAQMGVLDNIVAHCLQVRRVSLLLADHLGSPALNRDLIRAAALLHDITKTRSFRTNEDHAETGEQFLRELGYPEVGRVVGQHVRLEDYRFASRTPTEADVVNYADKRVLHDRVVPLDERMGYILEKYGRTPERERMIMLLWKKSEELELWLFGDLPFGPGDLSGLLAGDDPRPADAQSRPGNL